MDQRIVLVGRQQGLAAAGRAQDQETPSRRRLAIALVAHRCQRQFAGARGDIARDAGNDSGNLDGRDILAVQRPGQPGQFGEGRAQRRSICRMVDLVSQRQGK